MKEPRIRTYRDNGEVSDYMPMSKLPCDVLHEIAAGFPINHVDAPDHILIPGFEALYARILLQERGG